MMLVLVSIAMASILATAYLVSRDNSVAISRNSAASMQARWAALSALETTVALLQTETDWRLNHVDGVLLDQFEFAGATVTVTALDIERETPPDADSEYLRLMAVAEVDVDDDGMPDGRQSTVFHAYVPVMTDPRVSVGLDEFAVFAFNSVTMRNSSTMARWNTAPLNKLGGRINIATHATSSGSVAMLDNSACIDCTVYHHDGASGTLVNDASGPTVSDVGLPFNIPLPDSADPGETRDGGLGDYSLDGTNGTLFVSEKVDDIFVQNGSVCTMQGDITIVSEDDLIVTGGSKVLIDGNVTLVTFDDATITDSAIELTPGSTLSWYCSDDIVLNNAYVGEQRADTVRDHTGNEEYMNPHDIRIYEFDFNMADSFDWALQGNSVVKGTMHGKEIRLTIETDSALYGRFAGESLELTGNAGFFYDTSLDQHVGYTNPASDLFDGSGDLATAYTGGFTMTQSSLQSLADITGRTILANGLTVAPSMAPPPPPPPAAGEPTPRPVRVETTIVSFGPDMSVWEHPSSNESGGGGGAGGGGAVQGGGGQAMN